MANKNKCESPLETAKDQLSNGLDPESVPLKILSGSIATGEIVFLIQFPGEDNKKLVPAAVANIKYPQLVIKFYQDRGVGLDKTTADH